MESGEGEQDMAWWCMPLILATQEAEEDQKKFQASLSYRVNSRPVG